MKSGIVFYNPYHNGDLFHSKAFVQDIMSQIQTEFHYAHNKDKKVLGDIDIGYAKCSLDHKTKFYDTDSYLVVNTWVGSYDDVIKPFQCNLMYNYKMYEKIYNKLSEVFGVNMQLKPITEYISSIDYSKFDCTKIDKFISDHQDAKKILFSNGPGLSSQCTYNGNFSEIIEELASNHKDVIFVATQRFNTHQSNVYFTDDIIQTQGCDLNEIGYLSKFCDAIIGRCSGPFCFTNNKENVMNNTKTFICLTDHLTECFLYGIDLKSNYIFHKYINYETVKKVIHDKLYL